MLFIEFSRVTKKVALFLLFVLHSPSFSKDGEHTWLIYMCYFQEDGGLVVLGGTGGHKHDLEIVIVEVDNVHVSSIYVPSCFLRFLCCA